MVRHRVASVLRKLMGLFDFDSRRKLSKEVKYQLRLFKKATEAEMASYWEKQFSVADLAERFTKAGLYVEEVDIDEADFERWMKDFRELVEDYERKMGNVAIEKILEHYLTYRFLDLKPTNVFIDVAAADSPFSGILRKRGIEAWRQDLQYAPGINGFDIGSNAACMPISAGFADAIALHCAFECFQGNFDVMFATEAERVLRQGGRLGIIPLYIDTVHFVKTSPYCELSKIDFEADALRLWRDDAYREPFSKHYSPESFADRICSKLTKINKKILLFRNLNRLAARYPGQRIYCHFMFWGEKLGSNDLGSVTYGAGRTQKEEGRLAERCRL